MRKLALLFAAGALWLFVAAIPAFADGGPHSKATNNGLNGQLAADSCAGCHRAHTAEATDLLYTEQPDLCLNCHDGSKATTDVIDGVQYSGTAKTTPVLGALRGGGFQYALIDSSNPARVSTGTPPNGRNIGHVQPLATGAVVTSTHGGTGGIYNTGWGTGTAWGNGSASVAVNYGATVNLECTSCHNPHGNGQYRILQTTPAFDASAVVAGTFTVNVSGKGVQVQDTTTTGTHNYTIKPASDGANAGGSAANIVTADTGDYWRYHWDPTGTLSWALTSGGPSADQFSVGYTSKTQTYTNSSGVQYSFKYPVNVDQIAQYNADLQAAGKTTDPITGAALPLAVSQSSLSNRGGLMTAWCVQCHSRYDGVSTVVGTSPSQSLSASSLTANSADATFMFKHGTTRIGCEQCHVSHGSNALMTGTNSLQYTSPDGKVPAKVSGAGPSANQTSGDSRLLKVDNRGTCQLCHDPTGTVGLGDYSGPLPTPGN